jgi:hypothetical protein
MPTLGTTLFSLTPDWRLGADAVSLLERVAGASCGPAIEIIGHQAWRDFPRLSAEDERSFGETVDRLGLIPVALGVYTDLFRRPGRQMTDEEAYDDLQPQLQVASRLGFRLVRATLGMSPELLRRVTDECERLGIVLTFEVQGANTPDSPAVVDILTLQEQAGSPYLGLTLDFSLSMPDPPAALETALRRRGTDHAVVVAVDRAWRSAQPLGARMGEALAAVKGQPAEESLTVLVAGLLGRAGRGQPQDWIDALPLVHHAHAKFWDPDVESVREPHAAWLSALNAAGYDGAVVSEWGGHELLDTADVDALTVTRAHLDLLTELTSNRAAVTS